MTTISEHTKIVKELPDDIDEKIRASLYELKDIIDELIGDSHDQ